MVTLGRHGSRNEQDVLTSSLWRRIQIRLGGQSQGGQSNVEITDATEPASVRIALEFLKPFKASNITECTLSPAGDGTGVTWAMTGKNTLMTRIMGIAKSMDSMVGPAFEGGLANLKKVVEG